MHKPVIELPSDRLRPAVTDLSGATKVLCCRKAVGVATCPVPSRGMTAFYMALLAALSVLLMRWSGQKDISVGSPVAGRNRQGWKASSASSSILVLRTELGSDPTFREVLAGVKKHTLAAYEHQEFPLEKLVEGAPASSQS